MARVGAFVFLGATRDHRDREVPVPEAVVPEDLQVEGWAPSSQRLVRRLGAGLAGRDQEVWAENRAKAKRLEEKVEA